jgi:hypothetical protein
LTSGKKLVSPTKQFADGSNGNGDGGNGNHDRQSYASSSSAKKLFSANKVAFGSENAGSPKAQDIGSKMEILDSEELTPQTIELDEMDVDEITTKKGKQQVQGPGRGGKPRGKGATRVSPSQQEL